mmetsp:Transcript_3563/g.5388  ORF Transcript_3563/g.5388 Transcript_3563/m.5388 type:complete len:169 (+) Transcript_3563:154-660(+)
MYQNQYGSRPSPPLRIDYLLSPRQRLNTLFAVHAISSVFIGIIGYTYPSLASIFFLTENDREAGVARVLVRLFSCLIGSQGIMIWRARSIDDGEIKRAFINAYFICFLLMSVALIIEHTNNEGILSGKSFGILKIMAMIGLTLGYAWFAFFQPPTVFMLGTHSGAKSY